MIRFHTDAPQDPTAQIVLAALVRSVTASQTSFNAPASIHVFVSPTEEKAEEISRIMATRAKVLVFGAWPHGADIDEDWTGAVACAPARIHHTSASAAAIRWRGSSTGFLPPLGRRFPVKRFDFAGEWNNLGYGAIVAGSPWGISSAEGPPDAEVLAEVVAPGLKSLPYVALQDTEEAALLWWNRPVGPVDHPDWAFIEYFLADYGAGRLPCQPIIEEVPFGYDAALTMRLDCDEDIGSAAQLFALYRERGLPISLAVMTGQELQPGSLELLRAVHESGGGILTHSMTHAPNWGLSAMGCAQELAASCGWLREHLPGVDLRHAVSPFHQSPSYLPQALADAGLRGFIGGIIANDPETLVARGGVLPGSPDSIVTHSQQCMFHGDCMLADGDPLRIPKEALAAAVAGRALFGYLDHPISPRYDYGWGSFEAQLDAHTLFLDHIAQSYPNSCWMSADTALDWIGAKARLRLHRNALGRWHSRGPTRLGELRFALRLEGQRIPLIGAS